MIQNLQHKPPEGFIQFIITWDEEFSKPQQAAIEEQIGAALRDETIQGCTSCRMMRVRVVHADYNKAGFTAFLDCPCGAVAIQKYE
jgi:hypothetical protein